MRQLFRRFRGAHWSMWVLWGGAMGLLGLIYINIRGVEARTTPIRELVEHFRYPWGMLPIQILAVRNFEEALGWAGGISIILAVAALLQPEESPLLLSIATGVVLGVFAMHATMHYLAAVGLMHEVVRGKRDAAPPAPLVRPTTPEIGRGR